MFVYLFHPEQACLDETLFSLIITKHFKTGNENNISVDETFVLFNFIVAKFVVAGAGLPFPRKVVSEEGFLRECKTVMIEFIHCAVIFYNNSNLIK